MGLTKAMAGRTQPKYGVVQARLAGEFGGGLYVVYLTSPVSPVRRGEQLHSAASCAESAQSGASCDALASCGGRGRILARTLCVLCDRRSMSVLCRQRDD